MIEIIFEILAIMAFSVITSTLFVKGLEYWWGPH